MLISLRFFFSNIASELAVMSAISSQAQSTHYMCYMHIAVTCIVSDVFNLSTMNIHSMNKCKTLHVFLDSR